jgi:indolepyruvate decarboxylase
MEQMRPSTTTIAQYILHRLYDAGIRHLFGVPGDYVLDFFDAVVQSPIQWIGNCNELNAGYAADGYARTTGLGAAVVTYGVGGFSILNAVAGAYAEQVPLIIISGAPHSPRRQANAWVHHLTRDYLLQYDIFRRVTVDAAMLTNEHTAPDEIDRVIRSCLTQKRPVYLEIPLDMTHRPCRAPAPLASATVRHSDPGALAECVAEAVSLVNAAEHPVVLAGVELLRFGLAGQVLKMIEKIELPFATTVSSKSALPELHPQFIGIYQGALSGGRVRREIESSDCVLSLGVWLTDWDTGGFSAQIDDQRLIAAHIDQIRIKYHAFPNVLLADFIRGLTDTLTPRTFAASHPAAPLAPKPRFHPQPAAPLTAKRFYERLNSFLDDRMILMAEPRDAACAASDLSVEEADNFIVQAYYFSLGYCLPASLGVSLGRPDKRPVLLVGDGAFQMTAQELSTLVRNRCRPVIFLINNGGYLIERLLHKDGPYNDIQNWDYHVLPSVFGTGSIRFKVTTEGDLESALSVAQQEWNSLVFVEVNLGSDDCSASLDRFAERYRRLAAQK